MSGKGGQKTTMEPWSGARPALLNSLGRADTLYRTGQMAPSPYPGQRVAGMQPGTRMGVETLQGVQGASPEMMAALNENLSMDQTYRDFDTIRGTVGDDVRSKLAGTFAGGGINSGLAQDTYTRALTEALAGVEYGAYNDARTRQLSALGLAPGVQGMDVAAGKAQVGAGSLAQAQRQQELDARMAKYYEGKNMPYEALQRYSALARGAGGMGSTTTAPGQGNNIFGAGATGLGTYGVLAANPVTAPFAIAGGILGGLGSL